MKQTEPCAKGKKVEAFHFQGDKAMLEEWKGHGLTILRAGQEVEWGCLNDELDTIVGKSWSTELVMGDTIVHTKEGCAAGIRRYED